MKQIYFFISVLIIFPASMMSQNTLKVIPCPVSSQVSEGWFELSNATVIVAPDDPLFSDALIFSGQLRSFFGIEIPVQSQTRQEKNIIYLSRSDEGDIPDEGYKLSIEPDLIKIKGKGAGCFYALQSLLQMTDYMKEGTVKIPCGSITDYPRFQWRGIHLDVCRHFFPVTFIKKYIDILALYKMNVFHWHLTDDQGWRIQIKKYPELTRKGAFRNGTLIGRPAGEPYAYDTIRYGGYYTQDEIRDVVQYASARHITIVPEIEMPGHALAALASYPEYSCTGGPFEVERGWGVFDDVFCPREKTFRFLEDILSEVISLFPSPYIHIGGDECPKVRWKHCPHCQALIKKENLSDEHELQSYFIRRIGKFVNGKGRNIIGWDEILEGGLAPGAAVMSWRGTAGGIAAAKMKHKVVMSPTSYCYFDYYQRGPENEPLAIGGMITLEKVYSFEPVPDTLNMDEETYILGAQANLWTEYIDSPVKAEYMLLPRLCALSEVTWTVPENKDFGNFRLRLKNHLPLLDRMGVNSDR